MNTISGNFGIGYCAGFTAETTYSLFVTVIFSFMLATPLEVIYNGIGDYMRNIVLKVAYDGTNYHGFQRQLPLTKKTLAIQNVLEEKLQKIFGEKIELAAAGRTDAGVHALGQVVNFHTNGTIPVDKIVIAASGLLPDDIVVTDAWEADENFSARHSAKSKIYTYSILTGLVSNPFLNRYAWHIRYPLNVEAMREALDLLVGQHDFSAFRAAGGAPMSPVRTIINAELRIKNSKLGTTNSDSVFCILHSELLIKIHANGFLYHMARNIVGSLVSVGRGRFTVEDFKRVFESLDRNQAAPTAPPHGLCLYEVFY